MLTALVIMVIVARLLNNSITVETLTVFENYRNSNCTRGWIINPFTVDVGQGFGAIILAILVGGGSCVYIACTSVYSYL